MKAYNPVDGMNLLQKIAGVMQATATQGQSLQPILQQQMQAKQLADVGNVLAGSGIPEFAFKEQTPEQIAQAKQRQLAALGNPTAFQALQQLQERELTPYQQAQLDMQNKDFGLRQSELGLRREDLKLQREMTRQARQERIDDKKMAQNQAYAEKISKRMSETGAPEILGALNAIDQSLSQKGNIPGVGPVAGALPDFALSSEGKKLRQRVENLKSAILKAQSGLTVSDKELEKINVQLGTGPGRTEQQLRDGVNNVKEMLNNKLKVVEAGYPKDALSIYSDAGGVTSDYFRPAASIVPSAKTQDLSHVSDKDLLKLIGR